MKTLSVDVSRKLHVYDIGRRMRIVGNRYRLSLQTEESALAAALCSRISSAGASATSPGAMTGALGDVLDTQRIAVCMDFAGWAT